MESQSLCFPEPIGCALWRDPQLLQSNHHIFETITVFEDDSHFRRCLLRCRECGRLYFYELIEEIDWENGNDPQYRKYIPVATAQDADRLATLPPSDIARCSPAIHSDWPEDADKPKVFWVRIAR